MIYLSIRSNVIWIIYTWSWVLFVLLCVGIAEGIEGESLKLWDQGLCKDNRHKLGTFSCVSSVILFRSRKRSCFGAFLVYLRSRKSPREAIPIGGKYPTTEWWPYWGSEYFISFFLHYSGFRYAKFLAFIALLLLLFFSQ